MLMNHSLLCIGVIMAQAFIFRPFGFSSTEMLNIKKHVAVVDLGMASYQDFGFDIPIIPL